MVGQVQMGSHLIVPRLFGLEAQVGGLRFGRHILTDGLAHGCNGLVLDGLRHTGNGRYGCLAQVGHAAHQVARQSRLCQIGILLNVVATRAVALAHAGVHVAQSLGQVILQGKLGQQLPVVVAQAALDLRRHALGSINLKGRHPEIVGHRVRRGSVERQLLVVIVQPQTYRSRQALHAQIAEGGLMEQGRVDRRGAEL